MMSVRDKTEQGAHTRAPDFASAVEDEPAINPAFSRRAHRQQQEQDTKAAGLVLGIVGFVLGLALLAVPGFVCAFVALMKALRSSPFARYRRLAIAIAILALVLCVAVIALQLYVVFGLKGEINIMEARYQAALQGADVR